MRLYKKGETYFWDIDRFHFFTESEKCAFIHMLKTEYEIWKRVDKEKGGMTDMLLALYNEVVESYEND